MKLLVTAATSNELAPFLSYLEKKGLQKEDNSFPESKGKVKILITGPGSVGTVYGLTKELNRHTYDLVIQAGIAGAFSRGMALGSLWQISREIFADLGAEDPTAFLDLFDLGLLKINDPPFEGKSLPAANSSVPVLSDLPCATGITVNKVSGKEETIQMLREKYDPQLESMEGAAFHYVCLMEKVNFIQVRSVSNYVELRDKTKWDIPLAIRELNRVLIAFSEKIFFP